MRHAEKPDDPTDPNLSAAGYARAGRLSAWVPQELAASPDFIFAAADSIGSCRPRETVTPLSQTVGVPIEDATPDKQFADLAGHLLAKPKYVGKRVVIAWHHGHIPQFAAALGAPTGSYPSPWDPDVFNLVLAFDFSSPTAAVSQITEPF
jgi:hypothetical protein